MNWTINQTVDLSRGYTPVVWPDALMVSGDVGAHTWRLTVLDNGAPVDLSGATITGSFLRADGNTVLVSGSVSENIAIVTLTDVCYAVEGKLKGTIKMTKSGTVITLAAVIFMVSLFTSGSVIDPGVAYADYEIDASPKGVYADLAALNAGTPTAPDVTKIYITLDDGKWCYHNGTAWVAGGVYQAASVVGDITAINTELGHIKDIANIGIQYADVGDWENKYYYDWNIGHTAPQKNYVDDIVWDCILILAIPAGTYHYNYCFAQFSFVENIDTGTFTVGSDAGFVNSTGTENTVTIAYDFNLYLTTNAKSVAMFASHNLPALYNLGYYKAPDWEVNANGQTTYIVGNDYFDTIQSACDRAADDDIIFIKAGTYTENVKLWTRRLHLIGENKLNTILIDHTGNYDTPPLEMSDGSVSNMTIIQDNTAPTGTLGDGKYANSYCIHADWVPVALGNIFEIDNCILINKVWATVGIGLQPDYTIRIRNTQMIGEGPTGAWTLLAHDSPTNDIFDQCLIVQNCLISSVSGSCVLITKVASTGGEAWYQFDGCTIWDETSGIADTIVNLPVAAGFELVKSYGNTVAALNN